MPTLSDVPARATRESPLVTVLPDGRLVCEACGHRVIERRGYQVTTSGLTASGACASCRSPIPGRWAPPAPAPFPGDHD